MLRYYTALPRQKDPTDIFYEIELSSGNGHRWKYLPEKVKNIYLSYTQPPKINP